MSFIRNLKNLHCLNYHGLVVWLGLFSVGGKTFCSLEIIVYRTTMISFKHGCYLRFLILIFVQQQMQARYEFLLRDSLYTTVHQKLQISVCRRSCVHHVFLTLFVIRAELILCKEQIIYLTQPTLYR